MEECKTPLYLVELVATTATNKEGERENLSGIWMEESHITRAREGSSESKFRVLCSESEDKEESEYAWQKQTMKQLSSIRFSSGEKEGKANKTFSVLIFRK